MLYFFFAVEFLSVGPAEGGKGKTRQAGRREGRSLLSAAGEDEREAD